MDPFLLREKLAKLSEIFSVDYDTLRKRWQVIEDLNPEDRSQINPLELAGKLELSDEDILDFFLKAAQVGLLIPRWSLIDLDTGAIIKSWPDFSAIFTETEFSPYTGKTLTIDLENNVEVTFQVIPGLYPDDIHIFDDYPSYKNMMTSHRFQAADELKHHLEEGSFKSYSLFNSFELGKIPWEAEAGRSYRIISPEMLSSLLIKTVSPPQKTSFYKRMVLFRESKEPVMPGMGKPVQNHEVELTEDGFNTDVVIIQPGRVEIWIQSALKIKSAILLYVDDQPRLNKLLKLHQPQMRPFLNGKVFIHSRAYKEFSVAGQTGKDQSFKVGDLTVLFVEMEPNFELYEKAGDQKAFRIVQEMLLALMDLVTLTNGVVVKTLGTLMMAIFHRPEEGILSAEKISDRIRSHNSKSEPEKHLILKSSIHFGDALAIKDENAVDYFGKVITLGIRLQALADSMELIVTPELRDVLGDAYKLEDNGWVVNPDTFDIQEGKKTQALRCRRA